MTWRVISASPWLKAGLIRYWDRFNGISEAEFGGLMMQDYARFGVVDMADKQKMFRLIKTLNSENQFGSKVADEVTTTPSTKGAGLPHTPVNVGKAAAGLSPFMVSPLDEDLLREAHGMAAGLQLTACS
jgi:kinesin family protein 2/24